MRPVRAGILLIALSAPVVAEDGLFQLFDARPVRLGVDWRGGGEARWTAPAEADSGGRLGLDRESARGSWLAWRGTAPATDELWLDLRSVRTAIAGDARLPGGADPDGVWLDSGAGATWRRVWPDGTVLGASSAATWDGQPGVSGAMVWGGTGTAFGRVPLAEGDGLLLALNYDAEREVFPGVPLLPLLAWQRVRGPWLLLLGVPFSMLSWRNETVNASIVAGPLPSAALAVRIIAPVWVVAEGRWSTLTLRRAGRSRNDDRLSLSQWEWSGGLRAAFGPATAVDLLAGVATARRLGEGEDAADARRDGLRLDAAGFVALRGRCSF